MYRKRKMPSILSGENTRKQDRGTKNIIVEMRIENSMYPFTILIGAYITIYILIFVANILMISSAFLLYRSIQSPSPRARFGLISMCFLLILGLIGAIIFIPSVMEETRKNFFLLILPYTVCMLINPINTWTSPNENYRKQRIARVGAIITAGGAVCLMIIAISGTIVAHA